MPICPYCNHSIDAYSVRCYCQVPEPEPETILGLVAQLPPAEEVLDAVEELLHGTT